MVDDSFRAPGGSPKQGAILSGIDGDNAMSENDPKSGASNIKRRDFLAGALLSPLVLPRIAQAAVDRTRTAAPADTQIARLAVYPPLGISRVGNSKEYFLAPEVPGISPVPDGRYKDGSQKIKKQVQRFRVYAFNKAGEVIREISVADGHRIEWTVHVANTKAAWYGFNNPLDNGERAPGLPGQLRNQSITDDARRARMLVINPGAKKISGTNINSKGNTPDFDMTGCFWEKMPVKLGHLQTDDAGRLLVFPGDGVSASALPNNPISNFSDNDGWHDDWCDGVVQAKVHLKGGSTMDAENGWVACCGPDFAPDIPPFISLYDVMCDVNIEANWSMPPALPLSFTKYIYPFFQRMALMEWVASAANLQQGWIKTGDFSDPAYIVRLADPSPENEACRQEVFKKFRNPHSKELQQYALPYMLGDGINYNNSPLRWFHIPKQQYALLQCWAAGQFINDFNSNPGNDITRLNQVPLAEQPEALTRAALEPCSGGAFHPGVELTWPLRHKELYRGPFRIALATGRSPDLIQNLGLLLTPEKAFGGHCGTASAIAPQMPGDLTRWMGLPWQCDAFSCQQVNFANSANDDSSLDIADDFPVATWWPALLPIDVLPQDFYASVLRTELSAAERIKFFQNRVSWSRGVAGIGYHANASYTDGLNRMVYLWDRMGFVVKKVAAPDPSWPEEIPKVLYVEVDRGSMDLSALSKEPPKDPSTPTPAPKKSACQ
ncbi:CTQ-dependent glycine oxidase GoxA [Hyalangium rubrum]|uniref:CTQ-dependent glycine oxidase GoxA n=1 Tax=Hyalangium rubrum TaxID=3103134 RepID=A0ABU5GX13_9BACT|nr:CTQ-dependent glycine oxidase GoxA [Hyalangium sp. s54d21]MDY7225724.1 CTQ-dependent glycine oxidase GoxA [Hyalangium sp. s54d21]